MTQDVEAEFVDCINDCRKQTMVATRVIVMRKLMALKKDSSGGVPSNTSDPPGAMDTFHYKFVH